MKILRPEWESENMKFTFNHIDIDIAKQIIDASYRAGIRVFEFTNRDTKALTVFTELRKYASKYNSHNNQFAYSVHP